MIFYMVPQICLTVLLSKNVSYLVWVRGGRHKIFLMRSKGSSGGGRGGKPKRYITSLWNQALNKIWKKKKNPPHPYNFEFMS